MRHLGEFQTLCLRLNFSNFRSENSHFSQTLNWISIFFCFEFLCELAMFTGHFCHLAMTKWLALRARAQVKKNSGPSVIIGLSEYQVENVFGACKLSLWKVTNGRTTTQNSRDRKRQINCHNIASNVPDVPAGVDSLGKENLFCLCFTSLRHKNRNALAYLMSFAPISYNFHFWPLDGDV